MSRLRQPNVLRVFSFSFGPIKAEAMGKQAMNATQWRWARIIMAAYSAALALGVVGVVRTLAHLQ